MAILQINGEQREFPDGLTIAALVAQLGMKPDRVAVELNLEIVPRTNWEATTLNNGDKLEVVHFVGGGSTSTELIQRENQAAQASASAVWQCPTCSAEAGSRFCTDCGEKKPSASDLSLRHFFTHALGDFFHFDSKIFSSFRLLFTKPGFLTAEYLRGCRKPYLHPFQLFFIANLIYFVLQPYMGWSGLRTTLDVQTHSMSYSNMASQMVAARLAAKGMNMEAFAHSFDHVIDIEAKSLVVLMVLLYTALLAVLEWRKRTYIGQHLVFCLHYTAFWLITVFIGTYGGSYWVMRAALSTQFAVPSLNWDRDLFTVALVVMVAYGARALQRVYHDTIAIAILKAFILAMALHYILDIYRFVLFLIALYAS
jgi:thiamine biosynthesis protein ThiS